MDPSVANELGLTALLAEIQELRGRLHEAEDVIRAIRHDEVDAVVVGGEVPDRVYLFAGADLPYRVLVETMGEGAVTLARDGTVFYCNRSFSQMVQSPLEEVIGAPFERFVYAEDLQRVRALLREEDAGKDEARLALADGSLVPVYLSRSAAAAGGQSVCVIVVTDLTEQKRHEEVVASERLARSILAQAAEAIVVCDPEGRVTHVSRQAEVLSGGNPLRRPFEEVYPLEPTEGGEEPGAFARRVAGGQSSVVRREVALVGPDGRRSDLLLSSAPLRGDGGDVLGTVLILADITDRKRAEAALRAANESLEERVRERTRQVRRLSARLTAAEQEERRRIAQVLHDDLQQQLFGLSTMLGLLGDSPSPEEGRELLAKAEEVAADAMALTRSLATELSPPVLENPELGATLRWLAEQTGKRYDLDVEVEVGPPCVVPDRDARVLLYRALKEILFNVVKHAETPRARVKAWEEGTNVVVEVSDEGAGFDAEALADRRAEDRGFGLFSVRERLRLAGGRFELASAPGRGTRVIVAVPAQGFSGHGENT